MTCFNIHPAPLRHLFGDSAATSTVQTITINVDVARRLSATTIEMSWSVVGSPGIITSYSVKYRAVEWIAGRNLNIMSTIVNTTNTSIIITDLDPRHECAVSVAATTTAGLGNYSQEIIVGCE